MEVLRYRVRLDLDVAPGDSFLGEAVLELTGAPGTIRLDARGLAVARVRLDGIDHPFRLDETTEALLLGPSTPGDHRVEVSFSGPILQGGLIGLYRSRFPGGSVVASMMFPNGARRVFPCIDDPAVKSVFEFTLVVGADDVAISNTDGLEHPGADGRREVRFAPTPRMSTYLIFLAAGRFAWRHGPADPVRISVALPPGRAPAGEFALEHARLALRAFHDYYGIPYPLPKLDLVSIPDFWAGAMENWGAIAFQETRLLADAGTGAAARRRIRETVSHEIAHQWFGNLVTMAGWNDFWLNESFASFMQARIDGRLYGHLDTESDFLLALPRWGLRGDALRATHPVEVPVGSAAELGEIADEITYGKGAGVLRMIEAYLGEPAFREGIRRYLERFAYANARSEDLWAALEAASGRPVGRIMAAWIRHPGYPVLSVRADGDCLRIEQRRFLLDGGRAPGLWPVPLTVELDGHRAQHLLDEARLEIPLGGARRPRIDPGRNGFFRVLYEEPLGEAIRAQYGELSDIDRWGLLTDTYAFLLAGEVPAMPYLGLLRAAADHPSPLTGGEICLDFHEIAPLLGPRSLLRARFRDYFAAALERIGPDPVDGEAEAVGALRGALAVARTRVDPEYAQALGARFPILESVPGDLRPAVVEAYGATAGPAAVAVLTGLMFNAPTEEVARQMVGGLARTERSEDLHAVLDLALDRRMPTSRARALLGAAAASPMAPETVWRWLAAHLTELDRLFAGTPLLSSLLEGALPLLGARREAEVRARFTGAEFPSAERGIRKGMERMGILAAFVRRTEP